MRPDPIPLADVRITFSRHRPTPFFGIGVPAICGHYEIELSGAGYGTITCETDKEAFPTTSFEVEYKSLTDVLAKMTRLGFFDCPDKVERPDGYMYVARDTISAMTSFCHHDQSKLTLQIGSFLKSVEGGDYGPCNVLELGASIDSLAGLSGWDAQYRLGR